MKPLDVVGKRVLCYKALPAGLAGDVADAHVCLHVHFISVLAVSHKVANVAGENGHVTTDHNLMHPK